MAEDRTKVKPAPQVVHYAIQLLRSMEEDERMQVFAEFCTECGANLPTSECTCWRDD